MEQQTEREAFMQRLNDRGFRDGEVKGKREALLRLLARAGFALTEEDRTRIQACEDGDMLDRWLDNALEAKTAADVFSCTDP